MRRLHHDVQILFVHPALEARLEIAVEHALAMVFENARISKAAEQRLAHLAGIDAVLVGEGEGLGHRQHAHAGHDLVGGLGHLPGTGGANMHDVLAHARKGRLRPRKTALAAAGHDRQGAGNGADFAAGDRSINKIDAGCRQFLADPACRRRRNGAHIDGHQARLGTARYPAHHLGNVGGIGHHGNHQLIAGRGIGRADGGSRPGAEQGLHRFGSPRPDGDLMPALDEIERHRASHDAQADESDLHELLQVDKLEIVGHGKPWSRRIRPAAGKTARKQPNPTTSSADTGW